MDELARQIYKTLGSGYSERVYHNAMEVILRKNGIAYESERIVPIEFEGHVIGNLRADLIVDGTVIELKAVKSLNECMKTQATNYLKLTGLKKSILVNFPQPQTDDIEVINISHE
jgi:GxxExxY protein